MWVTLRKLLHQCPTILFRVIHIGHQTNNAFRSAIMAFKNGKAAYFNNKPLLFTGWHKAALQQN
jgi:hypothetical protein